MSNLHIFRREKNYFAIIKTTNLPWFVLRINRLLISSIINLFVIRSMCDFISQHYQQPAVAYSCTIEPHRPSSQTDTIILHYGAIRNNENVVIDIIESS